MVEITQLKEGTDKAISDLNGLMDQLRRDNVRHSTRQDLEDIVHDPNIVVAIARDGSNIVGTASLYVIRKVGKATAYIEDVVVDEASRGQKLGLKLMEFLIAEARKRGILSIELTSRPSREAANKLYQKLGFEKRETNVYKMKL